MWNIFQSDTYYASYEQNSENWDVLTPVDHDTQVGGVGIFNMLMNLYQKLVLWEFFPAFAIFMRQDEFRRSFNVQIYIELLLYNFLEYHRFAKNKSTRNRIRVIVTYTRSKI